MNGFSFIQAAMRSFFTGVPLLFLLVSVVTISVGNSVNLEYKYAKLRNPCRDKQSAESLEKSLLEVIENTQCSKQKSCKVLLHGPCDVTTNSDVTTNMRVTIQWGEHNTQSDMRKEQLELDKNLTVVLSPYLVEDNPCGPDRVLDGNSCRQCQPGTYMIDGICVECSVGFYSTAFGAKRCTQCSSYRTTATKGAKDRSYCLESCRLNDLVSPHHHLLPVIEDIVAGSYINLTCNDEWAFDHNGTKRKEVKCEEPIPECSARYCPSTCLGGYTCDSCQCINSTISTTARCDGVPHCDDGSDELGCPVEIKNPSSLQFKRHLQNYISVAKTWPLISNVAVCMWARLKLTSSFSSLISFEQHQDHSFWLKITEHALYVQLNKLVYREVPLPYQLDRKWFSVCVNVNHRSVDLFLDGKPMLFGTDKNIDAVQGYEISGDVVIGGMSHSSHPPYILDGLIKDVNVWSKPLDLNQVIEYNSKCLLPQEESVILDWKTIKAHSDKAIFLEQAFSKSCAGPVCRGLCPPDMWHCGSCDCIPLPKRCDRIQGDCLDGSDEIGCPLLDGKMSLIEEKVTLTEAKKSCLRKGGSLAYLSTDYILKYAAKILMYYDYDKAWALNPDTNDAGLFTKLGTWMLNPSFDATSQAALCQRSRTSIYRYMSTLATYTDSKRQCEALVSGQMATIGTMPQLHLLEKLITSHQSRRTPVWVGGSERDGFVAWNNGDIFSDLQQDPKFAGGDKLSIDTRGSWQLMDGETKLPFVCMVETTYNHTTSLVFTESQSSVVKITDPIPGVAVVETTTCVSFKSAKAKGTIISYATSNNDNELLVLVTKQALLIMIHNVPFFVKKDLADGVWHSLCFAYSSKDTKLSIFIDEEDLSIKRKIDSDDTGRYGSMILGAEQDFQDKTTVKELDQHQYFEGDISNFNIWRGSLSDEELRYLSSTMKLCRTILTRDEQILLRWGDVLNFGTQSVGVGAMGHNAMCRALGINESLKLKINGKALIYENEIFKLCTTTECEIEGADLRLDVAEAGSNILVGSRVSIILNNEEGVVVKCNESNCTLSENTGTQFILQSPSKHDGETLEPSDLFYFIDVDQKLLQCTEQRCFLAKESPKINLFSPIIEKRGWSDWVEQGSCTGKCGDSSVTMVRTCNIPADLSPDKKPRYCPGAKEKKVKCLIETCTKTKNCIAGEATDKFRGRFEWDGIEYEEYSVDILCPAGNYYSREDPLVISMRCTSDGFDQEELRGNFKSCAFMSESAQLLYGLVESDISAGNVLHITTKMKNIMENADDLTSLHLEMLANLTERALATGNITMSVQDNIIDTVDSVIMKMDVPQLWQAEMEERIVRSLLEMIDRSADIVDLGGRPGSAIIRESIALFVDKIDLTESIQASITIADLSSMLTTELEIKTAKKAKLKGLSGIGIFLPSTIRRAADKHIDRIWFSVFRSDKLFIGNDTTEPGMTLPCNESCQVASTIVGIGIGKNYGNIKNLKDDVLIQFTPPEGQVFNPTSSCVYWNVTTSWWSNKGIKTEIDYRNNKITCSANHLTNFAVLMNVGNLTLSGVHIDALQSITLIGGSVSIVCLFLTVLGLAKFKSLRKTPSNKIHISLSFSLMMGLIFLLIGLDRTESFAMCTIFAICIHFFYLSALCWMMVEGVNLYIAFVKVFTGGQTNFYKKCAAFAFGFPATVVISTTVVHFTTSYPVYADGSLCWLSYYPSLITFVGPVLAMLLANLIIFAFVIKQIFWRKQASTRNKMDHFTQLRAVLCLMALMGLGWIVGAFTVDGPSGLVFQYIFTITNISQGILIFYFHCASKPDVRNAWINSFSTTSSWSGKNVNQSHVMPSRVPSRNSLKKEEISAPKVPDDGVYNPFCNIMGINVPLKRRHSSDTIDSGYAYNPFGQLEYEERFTVDLNAKGCESGASSDTSSHAIEKGNYRRKSPSKKSSPTSTGSSDAALQDAARENLSPLFPPTFTPPPPPSNTEFGSKISFDITSAPPTPPPLMTFSESEQEMKFAEENPSMEPDGNIASKNDISSPLLSQDMMNRDMTRIEENSLKKEEPCNKIIIEKEIVENIKT